MFPNERDALLEAEAGLRKLGLAEAADAVGRYLADPDAESTRQRYWTTCDRLYHDWKVAGFQYGNCFALRDAVRRKVSTPWRRDHEVTVSFRNETFSSRKEAAAAIRAHRAGAAHGRSARRI